MNKKCLEYGKDGCQPLDTVEDIDKAIDIMHRHKDLLWVDNTAEKYSVINSKNRVYFRMLLDERRQGILESRIDSLTGLYNKRAFDEEMVKAAETAIRTKQPVCIALFDIDNFKLINDQYGHKTGDDVLKNVGLIFSNRVRQSDRVFRIGGEEFGYLMINTGLTGAVQVAEEVRMEILKNPIAGLQVTISGGVSDYIPPQSKRELRHTENSRLNLEYVRVEADLALYKSKELGRNRVTAYSDVWLDS